jgi:hypothetical protein
MKAFAVELPPGSIAIRVGNDTDRWGKSYDYEVTLLPDGTLSGLTRWPETEDPRRFNVHHMRALVDVVEGELQRSWKFERTARGRGGMARKERAA